MKTISFRVIRRESATCQDCKAVILPNTEQMFEVSPHLRRSHGFTDAAIEFTVTGESICPPMILMEARQ